ncbi:MAG TPA: hypothetical protein VJI75_05625 [Candidatus Nanoarchaeia archaeon]|nr:hypothetical protein [Candidatus Nanoarchaeia archaeon]
MTKIFDYPVLPEMPFLEQLAEELEGTLNIIAHAGHETDLDYIKDRQRYFKDRYERHFRHVISEVGVLHILSAYDTLQTLLEGNPTPENIKEDCEECLIEHLIGVEQSDDWIDPFQEFYDENERI